MPRSSSCSPSTPDDGVACSHGDLIPLLVDQLVELGMVVDGPLLAPEGLGVDDRDQRRPPGAGVATRRRGLTRLRRPGSTPRKASERPSWWWAAG